jgi:hypothetical protein
MTIRGGGKRVAPVTVRTKKTREDRIQEAEQDLENAMLQLNSMIGHPLVATLVGVVNTVQANIRDDVIKNQLSEFSIDSLRKLNETTSNSETTRISNLGKMLFGLSTIDINNTAKAMKYSELAIMHCTTLVFYRCYLGEGSTIDWVSYSKHIGTAIENKCIEAGVASAAAAAAAAAGAAGGAGAAGTAMAVS